jgi:hypothetical protein
MIIERDPALVVLPNEERANICHGVPFFSRLTAIGIDQPGRYAAFLLTRIHNIQGIARRRLVS